LEITWMIYPKLSTFPKYCRNPYSVCDM
jgi:hypothetical protein